MACSTPITPAAARTGELHSRPQTWTGNFHAIFWMMALSWSAALSNCGRFLWWHSEPCSLCPVGLGRNWYFLLQPQKKTSAKQWCDGVKCRHQQLYPPHQRSLFHIHHEEDNISVLTTKTTSKAQNEVNVGSRIASSSNPVVGPAAGSTQSGTAHRGPTDPPVAGSAGGGAGGLDGK
jgi:hypothetical protein